MIRRTKHLLGLALSLYLLLVYNACIVVHAQDKNIEKVTLQLKWTHQFQFAGYYAAIEKGFYRDEGLEVILKEGQLGIYASDEVLKGNADFGVDTTNIIMHRDKGEKVVVLADIYQHSPNVLIVRKDSDFVSPQNLKDKKIMVDKNSSPEIIAMLQNEGLNIEELNFVEHTWNLKDLITKKVDAYTGYTATEPFQMQEVGQPYVILNPISYGIDFYGDCLFTSEKHIRDNPVRVEKFLRASLKGWNYALDHKNEIIDLILRKYNPSLSREKLEFEAAELEKVILPEYVELGHISPSRWQRIAETYQNLGLVSKDFTLDGFLYDPEWHKKNYYIYLSLTLQVIVGVLLTGLLVFFFFNKKLKAIVKERTVNLEEKVRELKDRHSELNKIKEDLALSEMKFRKITEKIPVPVACADRENNIIFVNSSFEEYFGFSKNEISTLDALAEKVMPDKAYREKTRQFMVDDIDEYLKGTDNLENKSNIRELKIITRDGIEKVNQLSFTIDGDLMYIVYNDITEIKKAEAKLGRLNAELEVKVQERTTELSNAYKEMESFSYSVSHDLRAPLRSMSGFSKILLEDYGDKLDETGKHYLNRIYVSSQEMGQLIDELLNMSRLSRKILEYELVDMSGIVKSYSMELKESQPERFVKFNIQEDVYVNGDKILLQTALLNLISNAWKYTSKHESALIEFGYEIKNREKVYFVKDDGAGFDMNYAGKLFTPFQRLHGKDEYEGLGIGLSNVQRIIHKHGGEIWAESAVEKGTTFYFTLGEQ